MVWKQEKKDSGNPECKCKSKKVKRVKKKWENNILKKGETAGPTVKAKRKKKRRKYMKENVETKTERYKDEREGARRVEKGGNSKR